MRVERRRAMNVPNQCGRSGASSPLARVVWWIDDPEQTKSCVDVAKRPQLLHRAASNKFTKQGLGIDVAAMRLRK
jgi:hypothetical protein